MSSVDFAAEVIDTPVADEMRESFLAYSLSVITSRAIPDVRDGLKPVQRRILYSMLDMGIRPDGPHKKSARVVGDVMGKYHPHGDMAIYEALVRLGQDFTMRLPLVHPKGNFGSLDDPPAASRYTECRLSLAAAEMVAELGEDTVDFRPNYDGEDTEPEILPAKIPNLLVNGAAGIAVGMATNIPPHNLVEVVKALQLMLKNPEVTLAPMMKKIPGPDFPEGGVIVDDGGLQEAYKTGRGSIKVRALGEITDVSARRRGIIFRELPYSVGPERVIAKLKDLLISGKLQGISDVKDLSDRKHGLRLQIEFKTGVDPQAMLAELYRLTPLEETFALNCVVLVKGRPTTVGLLDMCRHFLDHRLAVVVRRTEHRLRKALERAHIVDGLLIALDNIDEVVRIIRSSRDVPEARAGLLEAFALSEIQAQHILDMPLRRLVGLEVEKLRAELVELQSSIAEYREILGSEETRKALVSHELAEAATDFGTPRRSQITNAEEVAYERPTTIEIADEPCTVTLSTSGVVGRTDEVPRDVKLGRHDVLLATAYTTARGPVWAFTSNGRLLGTEAVEIPEIAGRSRGATANELFTMARGERLVGLYGANDAADGRLVVLVTAHGTMKRLAGEEIAGASHEATAIALKGKDRVVAALVAPGEAEIAIVSSDAQLLRTETAKVRPQGRGAGGMAGMKLRAGATVVGAGLVHERDVVVTWTDTGAVKASEETEFPTKGRGTGGVRAMKLKQGQQSVAGVAIGPAEDLLYVVGSGEGLFAKSDAEPVSLSLEPVRRDAVGSNPAAPVLMVGRSR
jgi:DNA gyrase subunit A